jgi:hypothetical protein
MKTPTMFRGTVRVLLAAAVIAPMTARLSSQKLSICSLVTAEDASSIMGTSAKKTKDPSGCGWVDATGKKELNVAYVNVPSMFEGARSGTAADGKTQDEAGLGAPAFSTVPTNDHGNRIALYSRKGSTVVILDLTAEGAAGRLAQMRDVMRTLVAKL